MTWKALKEWIEEKGITDRDIIRSIHFDMVPRYAVPIKDSQDRDEYVIGG